MKTRSIMVRYEIDDNDLIEQKLFDSLQCSRMKDFYVLPDISHLDDDKVFIELSKMRRVANKKYKDYIAKDKLRIKEEKLQDNQK